MQCFVFKKGPNWQETYKANQENIEKSIKSVKDLINSFERI